MGKTPEKLRLTIKVHSKWANHPAVVALADKGHIICTDPALDECHLVLHPSAHMWSDAMWPLLDVTLKAARARKKGLVSEDE